MELELLKDLKIIHYFCVGNSFCFVVDVVFDNHTVFIFMCSYFLTQGDRGAMGKPGEDGVPVSLLILCDCTLI